MPSYLYLCQDHGEFEEFHSITEQLDECPKCKDEGKTSEPPTRLISPGSTFVLTGDCWAKDNYSK